MPCAILRGYAGSDLVEHNANIRSVECPFTGERLAADIPGARLEWIENARTFSMEDQPERLAELIAGFVREPAAVEA